MGSLVRFEAGLWAGYYRWNLMLLHLLRYYSAVKINATPGGKNHSSFIRRLNILQSSPLRFRDKEDHKDNSTSSHDCVDCEGTCSAPIQQQVCRKCDRPCCRPVRQRCHAAGEALNVRGKNLRHDNPWNRSHSHREGNHESHKPNHRLYSHYAV